MDISSDSAGTSERSKEKRLFIKSVFSRPIEEGTVMEITVSRPGQEPITSNIKIQQSDLELLAELKEFGLGGMQ